MSPKLTPTERKLVRAFNRYFAGREDPTLADYERSVFDAVETLGMRYGTKKARDAYREYCSEIEPIPPKPVKP